MVIYLLIYFLGLLFVPIYLKQCVTVYIIYGICSSKTKNGLRDIFVLIFIPLHSFLISSKYGDKRVGCLVINMSR